MRYVWFFTVVVSILNQTHTLKVTSKSNEQSNGNVTGTFPHEHTRSSFGCRLRKLQNGPYLYFTAVYKNFENAFYTVQTLRNHQYAEAVFSALPTFSIFAFIRPKSFSVQAELKHSIFMQDWLDHNCKKETSRVRLTVCSCVKGSR